MYSIGRGIWQAEANVHQHQGDVEKIEEILKNTEPNHTSHGWGVSEIIWWVEQWEHLNVSCDDQIIVTVIMKQYLIKSWVLSLKESWIIEFTYREKPLCV